MSKSKLNNQTKAGLLFAAPWFIGFSVFLLFPLLKSFYNSFTEYTILTPPVWIGLENYQDLFKDELFWKSLGNSFYYAFLAIPIGTIVAISLALLLNQKVKGQAFYRTFFFLPSLVPVVPLAILWLWLFNGESGIINAVIEPIFHVKPNWLGDVNLAKNVLIVMSTWGVGNAMVIYLAGLQQVPQELYEAANLDGASPLRKTWKITLPLLSPVIMFNVVMSIIGSLQVFAQPYIMFPGGSPERTTYFFSVYIYDTAFRDNRMGYASAMGWILFLIILVLTYVAIKYMDKKVHYESS
jgi:multiple sugar transport system permease protein